jgi:hypothetical protein
MKHQSVVCLGLIALLAIAGPARAQAAWERLDQSGGDTFYLDKSTLKKGPRPRIWLLADFSDKDKSRYRSEKTYWEADCKEGVIRILTTISYSEKMGAGFSTQNTKSRPWDFPAPQTIKEAIYISLCGKKP